MTFAENLNRICKEKGTTLTAVVQSMGLSTSKVSYWNNGSLPKEEVMVELAKKLECSVMDFFADEDDITLRKISELDEDEEELVRIFRSLDRRAKHEFMTRVYEFEKFFISQETRDNSVDFTG